MGITYSRAQAFSRDCYWGNGRIVWLCSGEDYYRMYNYGGDLEGKISFTAEKGLTVGDKAIDLFNDGAFTNCKAEMTAKNAWKVVNKMSITGPSVKGSTPYSGW